MCGVCKLYYDNYGYRGHPVGASGGKACLALVQGRIDEHERQATFWRLVLARHDKGAT